VKGLGDITPLKIQITSRELSFWGVLVYIYLSHCEFVLENSTTFALTAALTRS
jgi:hypothetical protein